MTKDEEEKMAALMAKLAETTKALDDVLVRESDTAEEQSQQRAVLVEEIDVYRWFISDLMKVIPEKDLYNACERVLAFAGSKYGHEFLKENLWKKRTDASK